MNLTTARLFLRPPKRSDAKALSAFVTRNLEFFNQWEWQQDDSYYAKDGQTRRIRRAELGWKTGTSYLFLMHRLADNALIGTIHFLRVAREPFQSCRLSYKMDQDAANQGYMTEGLGSALEFIQDLHRINRVVANVMERNLSSRRVLEKHGFEPEGVARQFLKVNGIREDHIRMVKLRD